MSSPANDLTIDIYRPLLSKDSEHENEGKRIKSFAFDCIRQSVFLHNYLYYRATPT
jgi:hypothetical protein